MMRHTGTPAPQDGEHVSGVAGSFQPCWHWSLLILAPAAALMSYAYTHLLATVEATLIGVAGYLAPLIFLVIDVALVGGLSAMQIFGVVMLSVGGMAFVLDPKGFRLRGDLTPAVVAALLFGVAFGGCESYLFKYLHESRSADPLGFFVVLWGLAAVCLLRPGRGRLGGGWLVPYIKRTAFSKVADIVSSLLGGLALTGAAVSQVAGMEALYPPILLGATFAAQSLLGLRLGEQFDRRRLLWKCAASGVLVAGAVAVA